MEFAQDPRLHEVWIPFPDSESKYFVSSFGRVKNIKTGRIHKINNDDPYPRVSIGKKLYRVHRAVCEAFLGECPVGFEVNHIDSDKANNMLYNLEYVTHLENMENVIDRADWGEPVMETTDGALACKRCEYSWYPKHGSTPKVCPRCKSYKWKVPKKTKKVDNK